MSATEPRGFFVALEGIDGSGTTTQARLLGEELQRMFPGREVVVTHEPSNTLVTKRIRQWLAGDKPSPRSLCIAFVMDRILHLEDVVEPALERGAIVVCDRYKLSTLAYQTIENDGSWVVALADGDRDPDLYVLLDVPVGEAVTRVQARGTTLDAYERSLQFQQEVAKRYHQALAVEQHISSVVLEVGGQSVIEVHKQIVEAVREHIE